MMTMVGASQAFGIFTQNRGVVPPRVNKPNESDFVDELRTNVKLYLPSTYACRGHDLWCHCLSNNRQYGKRLTLPF